MKESIDTGYELIKISEIEENAKKIAVRWIEKYKPNGFINLENKHKLASDIMNYARWQSQKLFAIQQFTGYTHAKGGYNIESLADSMGLSQTEWEELKKEMPNNLLGVNDINNLDKHFNNK